MNFQDLHREVIGRGLCTGCGMCAGICPTRSVEMVYIDHELEPSLTGRCNDCSLCYELCPGQDIPMPALDRMIFGRERQFEKELLGIHQRCLAVHATDPKIRAAGASGGATTALLVYALEQGIIDGAMVGQMNPREPWHTMPVLATTPEEVVASAQSKYQVLATNAILSEVTKGKKIGHVGLGCHTEAMRKLQLLYPDHKINDSIAFFIGIACHANFYTRATELLILEGAGVRSLDEVAKVEYRSGEPPGGFRVTKKDGSVFSMTRGESTAYFLVRYFRRERCLMCIDWSSEFADISVSDYWGPEIPEEGKNLGWSGVVINTERGEQLIKDAEAKGYLLTHPMDCRYMVLSGGLYQKKHGAVHNIMKRKRYGWPVPDFHYPLVIEPIVRDISFDPARWPHRQHRD